MERKRKNVIFCCLSLTKKVSRIVKKNFFSNHMSLYDLYVPACRRRKLYLIPEPRYVFSCFWCRLPTEEQKKWFLNSSIYTLLACKRGSLKCEKCRSYSRFPKTKHLLCTSIHTCEYIQVAMIKSIREELPETRISGCYFHLRQR